MSGVPLPELIQQELVARLETVTVANGFAQDVKRVLLEGETWTPEHLEVMVVQGDAAPNEEWSGAGNPNAVAWDQKYAVLLYVKAPEGEPVATIISTFMADCWKAITTERVDHEAGDWARFAGYAEQAKFDAFLRFPNDIGAMDGMEIQMTITYRVSETDPYTQR